MANLAAAAQGKSCLSTNTLHLLEMRHYPVGEIILSWSLYAIEESGEETYHY